MRAARTRAKPRSISRVKENFNARGDRSSGLTRRINCSAFGPITDSTAVIALTSVTVACWSSSMWRVIQSRSRCGCAEPVTS